ncbi:TetR/AcrR family transcriptional regulator [Streptomyces sp. NPDC006923]|uniref:TetR/AcrR family transcriptional regulator n=1 Tax=Streptomyces sp. NPDC006923 TaxID=3155355 RepID=UPI0033CD8F06
MAQRSLRKELVEAAFQQFHTHGYNGAGVKDITDAAGAPKGSFYNHFPSKEALAVVALERYGSGLRLDELKEPTVDPLVRLRRHFEFLRDAQLDQQFLQGCLFGDFANEISDHSETIRKAIQVGFAYWTECLTAAVADAQAAGQVSAGQDPSTLAAFLLNAWEGTLISSRTERSARAFKPFFDTVFGVLLR